jgi:hypothetical protein
MGLSHNGNRSEYPYSLLKPEYRAIGLADIDNMSGGDLESSF